MGECNQERDMPFDIFKLCHDGSEQWVSGAESFNIATMHLEILASRVPGKYAIDDRSSGKRFLFNCTNELPAGRT